jgi:tetratricopeptide (TPR) repeat protein
MSQIFSHKLLRRSDALLIAFVAIFYRACNLFYWSKTPWFKLPSLDEIYHHNWAGYIADGNLIFPTAFFRAPFYAYFLGAIYAIFGANPWVIRVIQSAIGVTGCFFVAVLACKVFEDRRVGILAGVFIALSTMPALFESRLLLDWILIPFGALALIFLFDAVDNAKPREIFLFGLFSGFFAITRPNILAVFPFLVLWLILRIRDRWAKTLAIALIGFALPILPVFIHNVYRGEPALVATQGGLNLYLGNNPETDGITPVLPGHGGTWTVREAWKLAEIESGRPLTSSEVGKFYRRKTIDYAIKSPIAQIQLLARKTALLLSPVEHGNNGSPEFFKRYSPPLRSPFAWGLFIVLATAGLPVIMRKRYVGALILWTILYGSTIVMFFVNARFRLPLFVSIVPISAFGTIHIIDSFKLKDIKSLQKSALLSAIALIAMIFGSEAKLSQRGLAESYFALGNIQLRMGELDKADSAYALALDIAPSIDRAALNRGIIAFTGKDYEVARKFFLDEIEKCGETSSAKANLGVIDRLQADTASAILFGTEAIEEDVLNVQAYVNLAQTLVEFGFADSALRVANSGLDLDSLNRRLSLSAGVAAMALGNYDEADRFFQKASAEYPPISVIDYELADIYSSQGAGASPDSVIRGYGYYNRALLQAMLRNTNEAIENFDAALRFLPNYSPAWASYGGLLSQMGMDEQAKTALGKAIETGDSSPEVRFNLGLIHARAGNFPEAMEEFRNSVSIDPEFAPGLEKIALLKKLAEEGKISLEIR